MSSFNVFICTESTKPSFSIYSQDLEWERWKSRVCATKEGVNPNVAFLTGKSILHHLHLVEVKGEKWESEISDESWFSRFFQCFVWYKIIYRAQMVFPKTKKKLFFLKNCLRFFQKNIFTTLFTNITILI